jgi:hypothetical protein
MDLFQRPMLCEMTVTGGWSLPAWRLVSAALQFLLETDLFCDEVNIFRSSAVQGVLGPILQLTA